MKTTTGAWSAEDHQRLTVLAGTMRPDEIARLLGRTESSIRNRARVHGISVATVCLNRRPWTYDETAYLFKTYQRLTIQRMADKLGRTYHSVKQKCRELELDCRIYGYKNHSTKYSAEDVELCRALFAEGLTRQEIAEKIDVPYPRVCAWVNGNARRAG